uniref:Glutamine amidotransferase type-2 domain-containing protein n=1 Tax=Cyclophora tenuis TaxID=216820 RepID=A0A7S1CZJ2_CYCTE
MWGIQWTFAHNGEVPKFSHLGDSKLPSLGTSGRRSSIITASGRYISSSTYHPVGDTDSEAVFCAILNALKAEFDSLPTLPVLHKTIKRLCDEIIRGDEESTILNFLLGCGPYTLFAYSWPGSRPGSSVWNGLHYIVRQPPFATAQLVDCEYSVDFSELTTPSDRVAVIATKPLTNEEGWKEFQRGELLMFDYGLPYSSAEKCESVERQGRGLFSKVLRRRQRQRQQEQEQQSLAT